MKTSMISLYVDENAKNMNRGNRSHILIRYSLPTNMGIKCSKANEAFHIISENLFYSIFQTISNHLKLAPLSVS